MFEIKETKLKTSEILKKLRTKFDVYPWYDDNQLDKDFPPPNKITTRYFAHNIEADEELKSLSADDLKEKGIESITLRERLLMELQYFNETGKHLDIDNWTLCAGSRNSGGSVPCLLWLADHCRLCVRWSNPGTRYPHLRARAAVNPSSLSPLKLDSDLESRVKALEEIIEKLKEVIK